MDGHERLYQYKLTLNLYNVRGEAHCRGLGVSPENYFLATDDGELRVGRTI